MEKAKSMYVVVYNDKYGDGSQRKIEAVLQNEKDFGAWLKEHNSMRDAEPETKDEFDIIQVQQFTK
jgi:hypothetical protein